MEAAGLDINELGAMNAAAYRLLNQVAPEAVEAAYLSRIPLLPAA